VNILRMELNAVLELLDLLEMVTKHSSTMN
jgi:hypothetical protein